MPPLTREALVGDDVVAQARGLVGAHVETGFGESLTRARIVETEAYRGRDDRAAHSYGYKRTKRTEVFFGEAGRAYVYLCYGIHRMFNVIVGPVGEPNAVLVRAVEPLVGTGLMLRRRKLERGSRRLTGGPGLVTQALGITLDDNGCDLFSAASQVRLSGPFGSLPAKQLTVGPRVGVDYAGACALRPWRFRESGNAYTSPAK